MNNRKIEQALRKIIAHIDQTLAYCQGHTFDSFMENKMLQEACAFHVLQIGELAKATLDETFTSNHPEIPWRQMFGMRSRIVHDYEGIQMKIVWNTIVSDFPDLRKALCTIVETVEKGE